MGFPPCLSPQIMLTCPCPVRNHASRRRLTLRGPEGSNSKRRPADLIGQDSKVFAAGDGVEEG